MLVQFHFTYLLLTRGVTYRVKPDIQWVRGNGHFDLQSWIQMEKLNWIFINTFSKDVQFSRRKKKKPSLLFSNQILTFDSFMKL